MYCPQCGQSQFYSDAHYCKRCGLALDRVRQLLSGDDVSPAEGRERAAPGQSARRKGVRQGAKLMFIGLMLAPMTALFRNGRGDFLPMIFLMTGFIRILYALIFQGSASGRKKRAGSPAFARLGAKELSMAGRGSALPATGGVPAAFFDMQRGGAGGGRPSVTEHTTRLLNETRYNG